MVRRRTAALLAAVVVLACFGAQLASAAAEEDTLQFTEEFLKTKINKAMLNLPRAVMAARNGTLKKAAATAPKQISVSCLNSVAPAPLNWKMWCPDTHATVMQWVDEVGSTHRKITLNPIANMTAQMAVWFMTPAFPKTLNISGAIFTKHRLWHPLDHHDKQEFKLMPGKGLLEPPALNSKLNEVYRPVPGAKNQKHYKTSLWVTANDLALNLPRNRYVLGMEYLGFQAFTLIVEFNDSPTGLVTSVEVILGAAASGYDAKNPNQGVPKIAASTANALLFESVMAPYRKNGDFKGALDAVTRHVVEEFGNLQWFVPEAWGRSVQGQVMKQLQEVKAALIAATTRPEMKDINFDASEAQAN